VRPNLQLLAPARVTDTELASIAGSKVAALNWQQIAQVIEQMQRTYMAAKHVLLAVFIMISLALASTQSKSADNGAYMTAAHLVELCADENGPFSMRCAVNSIPAIHGNGPPAVFLAGIVAAVTL
jgi:hypothetical protein